MAVSVSSSPANPPGIASDPNGYRGPMAGGAMFGATAAAVEKAVVAEAATLTEAAARVEAAVATEEAGALAAGNITRWLHQNAL